MTRPSLIPLAALLLAGCAAEKSLTYDEILVREWEAGPPSASALAKSIRAVAAQATRVRVLTGVQATLLDLNSTDLAVVFDSSALKPIQELVDLLEFAPDEAPKRGGEKKEVVSTTCLCVPDYTILLFRGEERIAGFDMCHAHHLQAVDFSEKRIGHGLSLSLEYHLTESSSMKLRAWEIKYRLPHSGDPALKFQK